MDLPPSTPASPSAAPDVSPEVPVPAPTTPCRVVPSDARVRGRSVPRVGASSLRPGQRLERGRLAPSDHQVERRWGCRSASDGGPTGHEPHRSVTQASESRVLAELMTAMPRWSCAGVGRAKTLVMSRQWRMRGSSGASGSEERVHGPPATQPAQQNGRPTWNVGEPAISIPHVAQVNGREILIEHRVSLVMASSTRRGWHSMGCAACCAQASPAS